MFAFHNYPKRIPSQKFSFILSQLSKSSLVLLDDSHLFLTLETGQEIININRESGLRWGAKGEIAERRERPTEGPGHPGKCLLLRLWPTRPPLGQHQPGHHPLYTVFWHPQVKHCLIDV